MPICLKPCALHCLAWIGAAALSLIPPAHGSDKLFTEQGAVHEGRVLRVDAQGIWIDMGGAQSKINRSEVARAEIQIPDEANQGLKLYQEKQYAAAAAKLEPVVTRYEGIPQEWIEQASYLLADCHVRTRNYAKAKALYDATAKFYPDSPRIGTSVAGQARAAAGLNDFDTAIKLLEPLVEEKEKTLGLSASERMDMSQSCLTLATCHRARGDKQKALNYYLKVTALYYDDDAALAEALYQSGILFEETNNLSRALGQYKGFLEAAGNSPQAADARDRLQKLESKLSKDNPPRQEHSP